MFAPAGTSATLFLVASWRGSHFKLIQYSVLKKKKMNSIILSISINSVLK